MLASVSSADWVAVRERGAGAFHLAFRYYPSLRPAARLADAYVLLRSAVNYDVRVKIRRSRVCPWVRRYGKAENQLPRCSLQQRIDLRLGAGEQSSTDDSEHG